jgi:hypothetical protein
MGKWSTYRKRGGSTGPVALGVPPAPYLFVELGDFASHSFSPTNVGGTISLESSESAFPPWAPVNTLPWSIDVTWGEEGDFEGFYYRAYETGNGINYVGNSAYSAIFDLT